MESVRAIASHMTLFLRTLSLLIIIVMGVTAAFQYTSTSWPKTEGVVEMENLSKRDQRLFRGQSSTRYAYKVDGKEYSGSRINFSGKLAQVQPLDAKGARQLRAGDKINVYYAPYYPSFALLVPGASETLIWWIVIAALSAGLLWGVGTVLKDPFF